MNRMYNVNAQSINVNLYLLNSITGRNIWWEHCLGITKDVVVAMMAVTGEFGTDSV